MQPKIVITGASGFIGVQLVPRLKILGCDLLLVGRNPAVLNQLFPDIPNCKYEEITEKARDFDALVHLAVLNNDVQESAEEFIRVNVGLLSQVLSASKAASIGRFVNITTFHALDGSKSSYANSKRMALDVLKNENDISVVNVFLPAVYGDAFAGRLSVLNRLPSVLRPSTLLLITSLVPTLHIDRLVSFINNDLEAAPGEVMLANPQDKNPFYRAGRRIIDLLFAVAVTVLFGWLLLIFWLLIRATSSGPGIFAQERIGQNGKLFTCYKLRTMKKGTKQAGTHEVEADAVTKIGAFLRRTKVDELPQVWNILRGELSLVGPRPCLPVQKDLIMAREQLGVLNVLTGITGLAQISGVDMRDPIVLSKLDERYCNQRGLLLDLRIIAATLVGKGQGDRIAH